MRNRLKNKKGFTLAELLIVVAIIGVLVAVSIPVFTSQLKKAKLATNQANARAAKAAAIAEYLTDATKKSGNYDTATGVYTAEAAATGTNKDTDPSTWTVDNSTDLVTDTFTKVGVTLNVAQNGDVSVVYTFSN